MYIVHCTITCKKFIKLPVAMKPLVQPVFSEIVKQIDASQ